MENVIQFCATAIQQVRMTWWYTTLLPPMLTPPSPQYGPKPSIAASAASLSSPPAVLGTALPLPALTTPPHVGVHPCSPEHCTCLLNVASPGQSTRREPQP